MSKRVLIVDDSGYTRKVIHRALDKAGYEVVGEAESGEAAIDMAIEMQPDVITLDNILPDMLGLDILRVIREEGLNAVVIMISAVGQQSTVTDVMDLGAAKYIVKPFTAGDVVSAVKQYAS